jgi:hypothetical protein
LLYHFRATYAAVPTTEPGSAREDILSGLIPVYSVDNGFQAMLDVPNSSTKGVSGVVCGNGKTVEGRREGRRERLMGLGIFEWLYQGEISRDLFAGWRL